MTGPLVSVILPVFNGERYLAETMKSVLAQTYGPLELIVIDDGSTDGSKGVAGSFAPSVRYFFQPNRGIGAARNRGVELARGSFFAFIDHDDLWTEDKLTLQMAALDQDPEADMVFGHIRQFISPDMGEGLKRALHCPDEKMPGLSATTMLVRRDAFNGVGPFEADWRVGEFLDWYLKAREKGLKSVMLPQVVSRRRIHGGNASIHEKKSRSDFLKILKSSLDRRRKYHT